MRHLCKLPNPKKVFKNFKKEISQEQYFRLLVSGSYFLSVKVIFNWQLEKFQMKITKIVIYVLQQISDY